MRWEAKAAIQAALSRLPGGYSLHRRLQRAAGTDRLDPEEEYTRKRSFLKRFQRIGLQVADKTFLELGTGWHPFLPLMLRLMGARSTKTVDVNAWLNSATVRETIAGLAVVVPRLAADFDVDEETAQQELARLDEIASSGATSAEVLRAAGVEYLCPVDGAATPLQPASVDYVVSSNVFEHLPPPVLEGILAESRRVLHPGGVSAHHIDPGDHFSIADRVTSVNFLKFSPRAWGRIASGLAYHNRLRCPDYLRLFEQAGFDLLDAQVEVDEEALRALERGEVRPHPIFGSYTNEELAGCLVDVFASSPAAVSGP